MDFTHAIKKYKKDLSEKKQKKAGQAIAGAMDEQHKNFLRTVSALINEGKINPDVPDSFIKQEIYASLDQEWKAKTDLAMVNIAHQLRLIKEFYDAEDTPDESPQLQSMIEELWQMKQRIEEHADVFVF